MWRWNKMNNLVVIEQAGQNKRFKIGRFIPKEDFVRIIKIPNVWYYKANGYYYLKPEKEPEVRQVLTELGFTLNGIHQNTVPQTNVDQGTMNQNTPNQTNMNQITSIQHTTETKEDDEIENGSKVLKSDVKVISKISKLFNIKSSHICGFNDQCTRKTYWNPTQRIWRCPTHGIRRKTKKSWYVTGLFNMDEDDQLILLFNDAFISLLHKINMKKSDMTDQLKGLRKELYIEQLKQVREQMSNRMTDLDKEYGFEGDLIEWHKNGNKVIFFKANKMMTDQALRVYRSVDKFIKGELQVIRTMAVETFPEYEITIKNYGDIPVLILQKKIGEDTISIGIRAPVEEYGKAYHLWVKMNDVLMFPSSPVELKVFGYTVYNWTWRIFHTKEWETRLRDRLQYIKRMEERAFVIINKLKTITNFDTKVLLGETNLTEQEKQQIESKWTGGNLSEFCELIGKRKASEGLRAFRKAINVIYKVDYERWLVQEDILKEEDIQKISNVEVERLTAVE